MRLKESRRAKPEWKYDPSNGVITKDGVPEGSYSGGYLLVWYKGKMCKAHRLAFELQGLDTPAVVDHINGVRDDNRRCNLRAATHRGNSCNRRNVSRSGFKKGAYYNSLRKQRYSRIRVNGKHIYLGTFKSEDEAHNAFCKAAREYHGSFYNPG